MEPEIVPFETNRFSIEVLGFEPTLTFTNVFIDFRKNCLFLSFEEGVVTLEKTSVSDCLKSHIDSNSGTENDCIIVNVLNPSGAIMFSYAFNGLKAKIVSGLFFCFEEPSSRLISEMKIKYDSMDYGVPTA